MIQLRTATVAVVLSAVAQMASAQYGAPFVGAHGAFAPATYKGEDDLGEWHLDLWPDQAFHLKRMSSGGEPEYVAGRWHATGETSALQLGEGEAAFVLEVRNAERLRPMGAPEDGSGDLVTDGQLDPVSISLPVVGMFIYYADAPNLVNCATGLLHPVAQEGAYLALERAYLQDAHAPAQPLFVTLDATIATREQMEGPARPTVTVERFGATWPGEDCEAAASSPGLTGTVWRIRSLEGEVLDWAPPAREPFLVLRAGEQRFNASVGCNTMLGGFSSGQDTLSFTQAASTMMACQGDLSAWEATFGAVLQAVESYRIGGRTLRLLDSDGGLRAELEAVYLP